MTSINQQIKEAKQIRNEHLNELFYVDYCNQCKIQEVRGIYGKDYTPCNHPGYCWHDGGEVQQLEYEIGVLYNKSSFRSLTAQEYQKLQELKKEKWKLKKKMFKNRKKGE